MSGGAFISMQHANPRVALRRPLWVAVGCAWLLMLITFSPAGRDDAVAMGSLDSVALLKLGSRAAVCLLLAITLASLWTHPRRPSAVRALAPWVLFAGWALLSTAWSPLKSVSLGQSAGFAMLLLLAIIVAVVCRGPRAISQVLGLASVGLLAVSITLVLLRLAAPDSGSLTREASGVMHSTNGAATASLGLLLLLAARMLFGWRWSKRLLAPGLVVHTAALVLANNRAALFMTAIVAVGLVGVFAPRFWRYATIVAVSFAGAVYLALDPGVTLVVDSIGVASKYMGRGQGHRELAELSGRTEMWSAVWESFLQSPWIGHGFFVTSASGEIHVWREWSNWTAHNMWLQILVSTGVVGAALMAWGLGRVALQLFRGMIAGVISGRVILLLTALGVWYLGWSMTNESFFGPIQPESVVFFVLLGVAAGSVVTARSRSQSDRDGAMAESPTPWLVENPISAANERHASPGPV